MVEGQRRNRTAIDERSEGAGGCSASGTVSACETRQPSTAIARSGACDEHQFDGDAREREPPRREGFGSTVDGGCFGLSTEASLQPHASDPPGPIDVLRHQATTRDRDTERVLTLMRVIDSVQIHGWTSTTIQRAVTTLAEIAAAADSAPPREENDLAVELVRWLRCAAQSDAAGLAELVEDLRPSGADASPWDAIEDLLTTDAPRESLIARLRELHSDPMPMLCTLLDEAVDSSEQWGHIDRCYQRAVEVLLAMGTRESLGYLLRHINLLCWERSDVLDELVQQNRETFIVAAPDAWQELRWSERGTLMLFFGEYKFPKDVLIELLLTVDGNALNDRDRGAFVDVLAFTDDDRAELVIHNLIERGLDEVSSHRSDGAMHFVSVAIHTLLHEMDRDLTPKQYERAVALGFDVPVRTGQPAIH